MSGASQGEVRTAWTKAQRCGNIAYSQRSKQPRDSEAGFSRGVVERTLEISCDGPCADI